MEKSELLKFMRTLNSSAKGIQGLVAKDSPESVIQRLLSIDTEPLSKVQLNQMLLLVSEYGISDGFFKYYWLSFPNHIYDVRKIEYFDKSYSDGIQISNIKHFHWGLERIFLDSLLCFGNIRFGFRFFCNKSYSELEDYFQKLRYQTEEIKTRGNTLHFYDIPKNNRYLISEMACKTYGESPITKSDLLELLVKGYQDANKKGVKKVKIHDLLSGTYTEGATSSQLEMSLFSANDILEDSISSEEELKDKYKGIAEKFIDARDKALQNTNYYLSLVNDLDVYVATSMRTKDDFIRMAEICDEIFKAPDLKEYDLRYFDPTISAANGHENKGLLECLMVKSAKILIYTAGKKESYGKDAEAAMALSLGKPVIIYCDEEQKKSFYKEVHPLTRLINFETGVAGGAIVCSKIEEVVEILKRIFSNSMEYYIEQKEEGFYRVKEKTTNSVVRIQTNDKLLTSSFWNYYHRKANRIQQ
jgi:hypothetical protein